MRRTLMTNGQWEKAWPTEFKNDLKAAGLKDSDIEGVMKATTMQEALKFLPKSTIDRNQKISAALRKKFGQG
jgi:hypothetical protein